MAEKRCAQCWRWKPMRPHFMVGMKARAWCAECRGKARKGGRFARGGAKRAYRRVGLDTPMHLHAIWVACSANPKLGPIPATLVAAGSCPRSCAFWGRGCYAENGILGKHWSRVPKDGLALDGLAEKIAALPAGQLWRWAVTGDLPGSGEDIDDLAVWELARANAHAGARGFTFTHKPMTPRNLAIVRAVNDSGHGFTVNLSANGVVDADHLASLNAGPVAAVLPSDYPDAGGETPNGRRVVVCPNETHGITCARCKLCAIPARRTIVGFRAHGQGAKLITKIVREADSMATV